VLFSHKDANEDLIDGSLKNSVLNRLKYPVSGTFSVNDLYNDLIDLYDNGLPPTLFPKHPCFGDLKNIFSVMRGHLVTGTGIPSHGKSNFTEWYVLNLVKDYNMKASFFSPEHLPMALHKTTFIEKTFGKNYWEEVEGVPRISKYDIEKYVQWANEKIYLTSPENGEIAHWDWILAKFKEQMITYGTDIFVIDAFNKVEFSQVGNPLQLINAVLTKLTAFASIHNVIIFLVAHPTKMRKGASGLYDIPTLYDVSGSADFRNQTHDGYCMYRFFADGYEVENKAVFTNLKNKYKFQGKITGQVEFDYHIPSGRYYPHGTEYQPFNLIAWDQDPNSFISLEELPNVFADIEPEIDLPF
jgi:twinkle protein